METVLSDMIWPSPWLMRVLGAVRDASLVDAWVGAGVLRDVVWGERYGPGFRPERVRDVDVTFFDPHDWAANDDQATEHLSHLLPDVPSEAKNQAAAHTWYPRKFGGEPVEPLTSIAPDTGTCDKYSKAYTAALAAVDQTVADYRSGGFAGDPPVFDELTSNVRAFEQVIQQKQSAAAASNDSATSTKINETGAAPIADKVSASL